MGMTTLAGFDPVRLAAAFCCVALVGTGCSAEDSPIATPTTTVTETVTVTADPASPAVIDDAAAVQLFFDAVVEGDRVAAEAVATEEAVAFFDPYDGNGDYTLSGPDDNGVFFISPGAAPYQCVVEDGLVVECLDEPQGP